MTRDLILGTAGHIDHGKTALVKALTGVDCDRLPEEKARGITIDIGFAHLDLGDFRLGIVDVPGHERFIKNMLAGATGIDLCCLVVAADDSVMPQTREHLEILELLGLRVGVIAVTKADLVDATTLDVVMLEIRELVRGTFLAEAPIVPTSARTGTGLEELKAALASASARTPAADERDWFRLAIDRVFVVQGHGTVVTGSVTSGLLAVGDEVEWLPRGERVRVRGLQHHDEPVPHVRRGMRAAVNLASVKHEEIVRGHELATPGLLIPSRVLTTRVRVLASLGRPLKHRSPVRVHLGTAEIQGTLALLDADALQPGQWGLAQLFLDEPALAVWGQPLVLRSPSAEQTLGGGQVLQPTAAKIRRRHFELLERIERLWAGTLAVRAREVAWFKGFTGVTAGDLMRGAALSNAAAAAQLETMTANGELVHLAAEPQRGPLLAAEQFAELNGRIEKQLRQWHDEMPLMSTHDRNRLVAAFAYVGQEAVVQAAIDRLLAQGMLVGNARRVALADHKPKLSQAQRKLREKIVAAFQTAGFQPPEASSFAASAGGQAAALKDLFEVCVAEGDLVALGGDLYLHAEHEAELRRRVLDKLAAGTGLTIAEIRDLLGTSRKFAVPLCEYLDRTGITRREGDLRFAAVTAAADPPTEEPGLYPPGDDRSPA